MKDDIRIKRREKSNKIIESLGITCFHDLPLIEGSDEVSLKNVDQICKRAIASLLSIQLACDIIEGNNYQESKEYFEDLLDKYGVKDNLLYKERKLFDGDYTMQDAVDVSWTYECYWALCWSLGLINKMGFPNDICNTKIAISFVSICKDYNDFRKKAKLRDVEEILDMLDLYYRYHWACVEKDINGTAEIKDLNMEVVAERRRGLEWLIKDEKDWNDITLNT